LTLAGSSVPARMPFHTCRSSLTVIARLRDWSTIESLCSRPPARGTFRWASGLRTSHFQKAVSYVKYDRESLERAAPYVETLAAAEGLPNHGRAVRARFTEEAESLG
jgi:hypothetical protein